MQRPSLGTTTSSSPTLNSSATLEKLWYSFRLNDDTATQMNCESELSTRCYVFLVLRKFNGSNLKNPTIWYAKNTNIKSNTSVKTAKWKNVFCGYIVWRFCEKAVVLPKIRVLFFVWFLLTEVIFLENTEKGNFVIKETCAFILLPKKRVLGRSQQKINTQGDLKFKFL